MDPRNDLPGSRPLGNERQSTGAQDFGSAARDVGREVREKAVELADQAKDTARTMVESRKTQVADELDSICDALYEVADRLEDQHRNTAPLFRQAADRIGTLSNSIEQRDLDELIDQTENFARRNSAAFLGSAVLLGFVAARFLKSSQRRLYDDRGYTGSRSRYSSSPYRTRTIRNHDYITYAEDV